MMTQLGRVLIAVCAIVLYCAPASAAIMYGDFSDVPPGSVMYTDVTESSSTDPVPPPLYGAPEITGNDLDFDPSGFGANATDGAVGADLTDGQLNFGFMTTPTHGLSSLVLDEGGHFALTGAGTTITSIAAGMFAEVEISHVNHTALANPIMVVGSTQLSADLTSSPGLDQPWGNVLFLDFGPALLNAGFDPASSFATQGEVVIGNTMTAIAESNPNTIALVTKTDLKVLPGVHRIVPEPTTVVLLTVALGLCGTIRRR